MQDHFQNETQFLDWQYIFRFASESVCNMVVVTVNCFQNIFSGVGPEKSESTEYLFNSVSVPFQQLFLDPS